MKTKHLLLAVVACATASPALGEDKIVAGPKGGRLLATEPHAAEFFVNADRRVEITFYDAALKPVSPGTQVVTVTAEIATGRVAVPLESNGIALVSDQALPPGEPYRVVVQVRSGPGAKPKNFRIDFNLETCGECQHAEYACTCEEQ